MNITDLLTDYGTAGYGILGFFKGFFGYPAILIGIFALVGSIVQRKKGGQVLISTLKTIIGFLIISGGAGILSGTLGNLTTVIKNGFDLNKPGEGMTFIIPSNEAAMAWITKNVPDILTCASIILILGMICNIILAKFSRLKYIYLTGHVAFYTSLAIGIALWMAGLDPLKNVEDTVIVLISGGAFLGLYMVCSPAASARYARKILASDELAMGHTGGFGYAAAGLIGSGILKLSHKTYITSTEKIKIPEKIKILAENIVALSLTMIVIYMVIMMIALGIKGLDAFANSWTDSTKAVANGWMIGNDPADKNVGNAIVFAFVQALTFVAGIQVVIFGVKMFLAELIPAFSGIATKLIKGSKAGVEVQAFWPAAPNGVVIGFICSFIGGLITFLILTGIHYGIAGNADPSMADKAKYFPMVLPELLPHLYIGGTAAVFANHKGGYIASIFAPMLIGFLWAWFPVVYKDLGMMPSDVAQNGGFDDFSSTSFAEVDHIIAVIPFVLTKFAGKWVWFAVSIVLFLIPIVYHYATYRQWKKRKPIMDVDAIKDQQIGEAPALSASEKVA